MAVVVIAALLVATFSTDAIVLLGGLAVAFGFQMFPSLAAICWIPWITREGASWGLLAGLLGVIFTENFGLQLASLLGVDLPWGRWPWTIHSAGWGMLFNIIVCVSISAMTQDEADLKRRMVYHHYLREHAGLPESKRSLVGLAWMITVGWMIMAIGPGTMIGNTIFGAPDAGIEGWTFGIPSIWAWQILFWLLGVFMMWFLAYRMEMSTMSETSIEAITKDAGKAASR